jgi:hypothetical protein
MSTDTKKTAILGALMRFIAQRPGLEFGNYGDVKAYRSEMRAITRDRHDAERLLGAVALANGITGDALQAAFAHAYSGRLSCKTEPKVEPHPTHAAGYVAGYRATLNYCAGQYFPTEYRKAACAVLASALWAYVREHCMPAPRYIQHGSADDLPMSTESVYHDARTGNDVSAGDWIRAHFRREFGRHIAARWFP